MQRNHLGLFDTPPGRTQVRLSGAVVGLVSLGLLAMLPVFDHPAPPVRGFIPAIHSVIALSEAIIAAIVYAQAQVFRSRALAVLAASYVCSAALAVPYMLSFPGAFAPAGLIGGDHSTTAWLQTMRLWIFPLAIISHVVLRTNEARTADAERRPLQVGWSVAAALATAGLATVAAGVGSWPALLPSLFADATTVLRERLLATSGIAAALSIGATLLLFERRRSILDVWLLAALSAWLAETAINVLVTKRFTMGWYGVHSAMLASTLIVMLALLVESNYLYARLALSRSRVQRAGEIRLMSAEAVSAAIAHEVGQPLTACTLSLKASLRWLTHPEPDVERAISSLRDGLTAVERTFAVIASLRDSVSREPTARSRFDVNDLVRETARLLDREMSVRTVSLELRLDEAAAAVAGNRVQLQRVLINLLTNAIDAVSATPRPRRIVVRSGRADRGAVLIEVIDTGGGIAPDLQDRIFEPFVTSKATGRGLGLPLSRAIVQDHGGRLWASPNAGRGTTFHLWLPNETDQEPPAPAPQGPARVVKAGAA